MEDLVKSKSVSALLADMARTVAGYVDCIVARQPQTGGAKIMGGLQHRLILPVPLHKLLPGTPGSADPGSVIVLGRKILREDGSLSSRFFISCKDQDIRLSDREKIDLPAGGFGDCSLSGSCRWID